MKILIIITRGDSIGGAQTHVVDLGKAFTSNGHDVLVCYGGKSDGPFRDLLTKEGLKFTNLPFLKREISLMADIKTIFALKSIIKDYRPDIVSLHSSKAGILGRISGFITKTPVVVTVHGWAFTDGVSKKKALIYKFLEKALSGLVNKFVLVSNYDKEIAIRNRITRLNKLVVIHNGITLKDIDRSGPDSGNSSVNLTMVARFDEQKDHITLIKSLQGIKNFKLHLLGDGPNLPSIKRFAENLGFAEQIKFYGYCNDVPKVLKNSDIFLLISNWEGFPISTLEAMNFELPVIVSDVGGAAEAIIDAKTGFVIKRGDEKSLREKISLLIENKKLRIDMGRKGKIFLSENFSVDVMYSKVLLLYREILKN
jgi:glycosyltransferase involved in cell wall biosynthesis